jgi:hypothetical protein
MVNHLERTATTAQNIRATGNSIVIARLPETITAGGTAMPILLTVRNDEFAFSREYRVELTAIERNGNRLKWVFRTLETEQRTLIAYTHYSPSPASKCVNWAIALLDRPLPTNGTIDLEQLVGKTAIALVEIRKRNNTDYYRVVQLEPDY